MTRARPTTREGQRAATRELLLKVGRKVFAKHGFDATSVAMICRAARVTHGALYHHFPGKMELFVEVLQELTREVSSKVEEAAIRTAGWAQIEAACSAYLDACTDPVVQVILFREGPRVLSAAHFAAIDHGTNEPLVYGLLQRWADAGLLRKLPVAIVGPMLGGAFAEAGAAIASADDPKFAREVSGNLLLEWMGTLRPGRPGRG